MTDFFDWLTASDSGLAADRLASAYNLSSRELHDTVQALAPAYSLALARAMSDPAAAADLSRQFAPFFGASETMSRKAADRSRVANLTYDLFGSKVLVDAVSRQVSSVTGTAPDVVELLMRNLTLMSMQTILQMVGASVDRLSQAGEVEPSAIPNAMADLMRRGANALEAFSRCPNEGAGARRATPPMDAMFADAFKGPLPWLPPMPTISPRNALRAKSEATGASAEAPSTLPPMPFLAIFEGFARGLSSQGDASHPTAPSAPPKVPASESVVEAPPLAPDPSGFQRLVDAGAEMQADYLSRLTALFDANPRTAGKSTD